MELIVLIGLAVLLIGLAVGRWVDRIAYHRQRQRIAAARLGCVEGSPAGTAVAADRRGPARASYGRSSWLMRNAHELLLQAGLELAPQALVAAMIVLALVSTAAASLWLPIVPAIAIGLAALCAPLPLLRAMRRKRLKTIGRQVPYLLDMLKSALESGHTIPRGIQMAAQNCPEPLARELRTMVDQTRVGIATPFALEAMYRRVPIEELGAVAGAVGLQEESGSSLAEILDHVAASVRSRQRLEDQIRAITSQSRLSSYIVSALPVIILLVFSLIRRDYVYLLFTDPIGIRMLEAAIAMDVVAFFIMRGIAKVDY